MVVKNERGWRGAGDKYFDSWQEAEVSFAERFGWRRPARAVTPDTSRNLRAFLSHVHEDKPSVLEIYNKLIHQRIEAWIDKKNLVAGQKWKKVITDAIQNTDAFILFLSSKAQTNRGYFRREIREALSISERLPDGYNFLIPVKLEECSVPRVLGDLHWVNYYESDGFSELMRALRALEQWIRQPAT